MFEVSLLIFSVALLALRIVSEEILTAIERRENQQYIIVEKVGKNTFDVYLEEES